MYKQAKQTGWGSLVPDFDQGRLTEKEFHESMNGQTIHKLRKEEFEKLERFITKYD